MTVDPTDEEPDDPAKHDQPPDESVLLGATGVNEQVEAELARAEAELEGDAPESDDGGAVV